MQKTALVAATAALALSASAAALAAENPTLTVRQLEGMAKQRENSDKVRQIFALDKAGDTVAAQAIYETLPEGMKRGVDNGRAARDGKMDPKSQAVADNTKALYAAVKANDIEATTAAFANFSDKAKPGVLKTLTSMVGAGRVTPAMAEAISKLA